MLPMRVWDAPTRLFHWVLVLLLAACYLTDRFSAFELHKLCGETVLALLLFRVVWGFIGSETARFSHFLGNPTEGLRHLLHFRTREPDTQVGHNAAGGWMVLVMLLLLGIQVGTGLFTNDVDSFVAGPLAGHVSEAAGGTAWSYHRLNFTLIEIVIALHILAILGYALVKRHDLVRPMVSGKKRLPAATRAPRMAANAKAAGVFIVCAAVVWVIVTKA